jgi:hypothetical protein
MKGHGKQGQLAMEDLITFESERNQPTPNDEGIMYVHNTSSSNGT